MSVQLDHSIASHEPGTRSWWRAVSIVLIVAVFLQAVFAGAMLSGFEWARAAHMANAVFVVAATFAASLVSLLTLRRIPGGMKLGLFLLVLAGVVFVQFALGRMAAKGANLMWLHIPLGVVAVGLAGQVVAAARALGLAKGAA